MYIDPRPAKQNRDNILNIPSCAENFSHVLNYSYSAKSKTINWHPELQSSGSQNHKKEKTIDKNFSTISRLRHAMAKQKPKIFKGADDVVGLPSELIAPKWTIEQTGNTFAITTSTAMDKPLYHFEVSASNSQAYEAINEIMQEPSFLEKVRNTFTTNGAASPDKLRTINLTEISKQVGKSLNSGDRPCNIMFNPFGGADTFSSTLLSGSAPITLITSAHEWGSTEKIEDSMHYMHKNPDSIPGEEGYGYDKCDKPGYGPHAIPRAIAAQFLNGNTISKIHVAAFEISDQGEINFTSPKTVSIKPSEKDFTRLHHKIASNNNSINVNMGQPIFLTETADGYSAHQDKTSSYSFKKTKNESLNELKEIHKSHSAHENMAFWLTSNNGKRGCNKTSIYLQYRLSYPDSEKYTAMKGDKKLQNNLAFYEEKANKDTEKIHSALERLSSGSDVVVLEKAFPEKISLLSLGEREANVKERALYRQGRELHKKITSLPGKIVKSIICDSASKIDNPLEIIGVPREIYQQNFQKKATVNFIPYGADVNYPMFGHGLELHIFAPAKMSIPPIDLSQAYQFDSLSDSHKNQLSERNLMPRRVPQYFFKDNLYSTKSINAKISR